MLGVTFEDATVPMKDKDKKSKKKKEKKVYTHFVCALG